MSTDREDPAESAYAPERLNAAPLPFWQKAPFKLRDIWTLRVRLQMQCGILRMEVRRCQNRRVDLQEYGEMQNPIPSSQQNLQQGIKVEVPAVPYLHGGKPYSVKLLPGITTLVGPNGVGKTKLLRAIAARGLHTPTPEPHSMMMQPVTITHLLSRFISSGRNAPLERFRSATDNPHRNSEEEAAVGHSGHRRSWHQIEGITGDLMELEQRPDLRLKVEARLQRLFSRSLRLEWTQAGLRTSILSMSGGAPYFANSEASGILQLVGLLAAIHNDKIKLLVIDEPEISLHPQHQAFLRQEMESVAGDPLADPSKKMIVVATHSPGMLRLRRVENLADAIFFSDSQSVPVQIAADDPLLRNQRLKALVGRLSSTHQLALFAAKVLLVEGPSDETIAAQLADALDLPLMADNAQIVPVTGKGEFAEVTKLFRAMGKQVVVLADLDALADSNALVTTFSDSDHARTVASEVGHGTLVAMDAAIRNAMWQAVRSHWDAIEPVVSQHAYWQYRPSTGDEELHRRRAALAQLLLDAKPMNAATGFDFHPLRTQFGVLLKALERVGVFMLRRGTVEDYYQIRGVERGKPEAAASEAATFLSRATAELQTSFSDIARALEFVAPVVRVDENELLRGKLAACLGTLFAQLQRNTPSARLDTMTRANLGSDADLFGFENVSDDSGIKLKVEMKSPLFQRASFPLVICETDNANLLLKKSLPSL